ncbi:SDR family NAD(P)-dependent oxidoreductase [Pseudarthrobacter sp. NIBRBAC000502772]|uniref:SDR family NAD(P)-dependent oxidoreductase n=1 Tax=Pseudarthrobacter sp. NIBRBAC000502772 TaxID=2590775 RepID=UPI00113140E0|nr:SDR family NAD(P)-dependent oxidoreductase [Pseudarthrobacter sp. NIBRBAC000502772]QDG66696.1 SDR family NAD(P)-dependent oxidoreductase [Pseudarthrobacter sp. NIBRBAC000502772]
MNTLSLENRAAVVTGSSRGLGRAIARGLAEAGASVVINGTDAASTQATVDVIREQGGTAVACVGSIADAKFCEDLIAQCVESFGTIDVLVNNAGVTRDRSLVKMTPEEFDTVTNIHLRGTWACSGAAARAMRETGGSIVNVASGSGLFGMFGQSNYAAAKAGIIGLSRVMTMELARFGVRTNVIAPVARTGMTDIFYNAADGAGEGGVGHASPFPPAETVAPIVTFLAGPASAHIGGQILSFDGSTLSVWSHPEATSTWELDRVWGTEDFAGLLTDEVLQYPHPDKWGSGVQAP